MITSGTRWRQPHVYETAPHQLKMPGYDFTPDEALDVTIALLAQIDPQVLPDAFVIRGHAGDSLAVGGEFGELIERYRCLSCHSVERRRATTSPTISAWKGAGRARNGSPPISSCPTRSGRSSPCACRSSICRDHEAQVLAEGITTIVARRGASIPPAASPPGRARSRPGDALFESKRLHGLPPGRRTGRLRRARDSRPAPRSGKKLRPGWIVTWLENPQAIKPDVLEPRYGFSREQARELTAYLMSLSAPSQGGSK